MFVLCKRQNFYWLEFHGNFHDFPLQILRNYYNLKFDIEELSLKFFPFHIIILIYFVSKKLPIN